MAPWGHECSLHPRGKGHHRGTGRSSLVLSKGSTLLSDTLTGKSSQDCWSQGTSAGRCPQGAQPGLPRLQKVGVSCVLLGLMGRASGPGLMARGLEGKTCFLAMPP